MSYNVAICLAPVPADDRTAWQQLELWIDEEGSIPDQFQELLARLTARYPCICDLPDEAVDDGVWSDGPLRNNLGHRVTVLGLVPSRAIEVMPFLVLTANALGMSVFDWQSKDIYRPEPAASPSPTRWWQFWK